jgi:hypothetical protein
MPRLRRSVGYGSSPAGTRLCRPKVPPSERLVARKPPRRLLPNSVQEFRAENRQAVSAYYVPAILPLRPDGITKPVEGSAIRSRATIRLES